MAPSFLSQLMTSNDKSALGGGGLPTLGSMMSLSAASGPPTTPTLGPAAAPPILPQLSPALAGRAARPDALKFGLPLPLNLSTSTAANPMGVPGGLGRPNFRRQTSQGDANAGGLGPPASSGAASTGRSIPMAPSPWNNNQKIQDFFLHITDMEKAAHAENKIIDIRELIARNAPSAPTRPQGVPEEASPEQDSPAPGTGNNAGFKNALSELLAARQGGGSGRTTPAPSDNQESNDAPEPEKEQDNNSGSNQLSREETRNALADMLNKRGGGSPVSDAKAPGGGREALMAMLAKRAPPQGNEEEPATPKPSSRADMLSEMLAKRGKPAVGADDDDSNNAKPVNPLAAMLAKRAGSMQSAGEESTPKAANPLEEMMRKRSQAANGGESASTGVALKDDPKYAQYFKMLKIGHPREVVKHKMQRDGIDPYILDCDPTKPAPPKPTESTPASSEDCEDDDIEAEYQAQLKEYNEKHGKYTQMIKVGLPPTVVQHKMRMDGVNPEWLNGPPTRRPKPSAGPSEEEIAEHKKKYEKYFKMLRMGLSRGAVEHKMRMAGIDPKELDGPRRPSTSAGASTAATPVKKPNLARQESIRKKLHWEVKRRDSDAPRESLWGLSSEMTLDEVQISTESKQMLEKLFVKDMTEINKKRDAAGADVTGKGTSPAVKKKPMIALIDMKKSQNIAITLARVKMGFPELKRELLAMNPSVLSTAQLQSLIDMWPDNKEEMAIKKFSGDLASIGSGEKFLYEARNIPRFKEKLACLIFKQEFPSRVHELKESINLVIRGVDQVCSSKGLRQLFIYILQIGNLLNFGSDGANTVEGFSLGSLVKFSQTKAFVGGITFLQYVVQSIERDVPHLARFYDEIDLISKCCKVSFHSLTSEKNALEAGCKKILLEAEQEVTLSAGEDLQMSSTILKKFAAEIETELEALEKLLDDAEKSKAHFLKYFEEEGTDEELDVLLSHIANFTAEYHREHLKYLEKMKREMKGLFNKFSPSKNPVSSDNGKKEGGVNGKSEEKMKPVLRRRTRSIDEGHVAHPPPVRVIHEPKPLVLEELSGQSDSEPDFDDVSVDGMSVDGGSVPPSPSGGMSEATSTRPGIATRSA